MFTATVGLFHLAAITKRGFAILELSAHDVGVGKRWRAEVKSRLDVGFDLRCRCSQRVRT